MPTNTKQDCQIFHSEIRYSVICWIGDKEGTGFEGCRRTFSKGGKVCEKKGGVRAVEGGVKGGSLVARVRPDSQWHQSQLPLQDNPLYIP